MRPGGAARRRRGRPGARRGRDQRPARDDRRLGSRGPGGRSTTRSCGRTPGPRRPASALAAAGEGGIDRFRARTGLPISTYSSALKLAWILDAGGTRTASRRGRAATCSSGRSTRWLIWHLTGGADGGVHVTDVTNASRTMLMDLETLAWDPALLDDHRRPGARCCPAIRGSSEVYGTGVGDLAGVPIARRPRRPARGALRAGLLRGRPDQVHLRHGLLHAHAHGRAPGRSRATA